MCRKKNTEDVTFFDFGLYSFSLERCRSRHYPVATKSPLAVLGGPDFRTEGYTKTSLLIGGEGRRH